MHSFIQPAPLAAATRSTSQLCVCRRRPRPRVAQRAASTAAWRASAVSGTGSGPAEQPIRLVASDVDGTLLTDQRCIAPPNVVAIRRLLAETDTLFVPATGKSRPGALRSLGPELCALLDARYPAGVPGVYLQGLLVFGAGGEIVFESVCEPGVVHAAADLAKQLDLDLIGYSRDEILTERATPLTDTLPDYHEPQPVVVESWDAVLAARPINKLIFMAHPDRIIEIRPTVQQAIGDRATLTQAQPDMLEVLPPNASKGNGARKLFDALGIDANNVLAIGDAENDLELLSAVGYSCAVGNALPSVKAVAKYTDLKTNNEGAVADALERFLLPTSVGSS